MGPGRLPMGQVHTWSLICTVATTTGTSHPLSSDRIGLTVGCLLDSSLTFMTSVDVVDLNGYIVYRPFLSYFALSSDSATSACLLPASSVPSVVALAARASADSMDTR